MAKLSVQERLERLREAGRKQSGQGGQQSSPAPAATSGRTTAGMTVRERLNRLKEAGRQQSPSLPTVTSQAAGELRTLRDEAQQEFLNFRGAEITAGAAGMPTESYAGQRYRTAEEAYRARQDYDRQLAELRNRYYQEENEQQRARLAEDASMQASFARADEIRGALNRIQTLEQTRVAAPGPVTEDAVNQAVREIAGQYGLSREDSRNLTTVRKALEAQLLEETDRISAAGYDYERMTEYQKRQERAAEAKRQRQQTEAWADEHPVLASLASVGASALQAVDIPRLIATGGGSEDDLRTYTPADPNAAIISNFVTGVRDTVSKKIADNTDWELFGQNVASFLYNTGMSIGDSASQVALLGPWATYLMGASAASQQAVNVLERGGSNSQAFWGGLAAGAAEAVFERFSIEKLLEAKTINSVKDLLRATAQQAGTEASEEMLTEIANILSDTAIMGESSDFEQLVTQYQLMGMDEDEARKQAYLDSVAQVVWAGVGGALSGMAMGGATSGVDLAGRNIRQGIRDYQARPADSAYDVMREKGMFSPEAREAVQAAERRRGVTEAVDRAAWMMDPWNRRSRREYLKNRGRGQDAEEAPPASQQAQSPQATQAVPAGTQTAAPEGAAQVQQDQAQPAGRQTQATPAADPVIQTLESGYLDGIDEAPVTAERMEQNGQQGAEPGDGVSDGDLGRLSGTGAGEQTGGVETGAERGRGPADAYRAARERQNSVHDLRGEPVSSQDLGLPRGTDAKTLQVIPESAWDDGLRATADRVREETGLDIVFVIGGIQIGTPDGVRLVRGVFTGDRIIVQADNIRVTPDQIVDHEIFHVRAAQTPGLIRELEDRVREQYGPEDLGRVVEQYIRKLRGVISVTENAGEDGTQAEAWAILEEIFADAYAGINAFSVHAERFNETVEQTMTERGVGRGSQNAAATDRTTGPPAEGRYSFGGENARRADLDALDRAKEMERQGVAMETIFRETGWYTGADGKWRFEIDDSGMEYSRWGDLNRSDRAEYARFRELEGKFIDGTITQEEQTELRQLLDQGHGPGRAEEQQTLRLADFLRHDELYQNYPQLRQAALRFADLPEGTHGSYNTGTNTITLNNSLRDAPEDTLVHEIQHAIQSAEGFSGGSSPEYWARREYETGDLVSNRLQQEYDQILNGLGREDQNKYIRYTELERELERLFLADSNTEAGRRYDRLEAEQDAIYEELYPNAWFRQLLDLSHRMEDTAGEYRRMYENTAGEIEARDVTARRQLTPEQRRQTMPNTGDENTVFSDSDAFFSAETDTDALKERQMQIIQETNPADDDYHTWIRSAEEIKTFREAIEDPEWAEYDEYNPDFTRAMAEEALESGEIEVFSSYPIEAGGFVSPSRMEAESYSGNGRVYSKTVPLTDVAWIDPTQGQYAPVDRTMYSMSEPTDAQQDEAERLLFQGVDADTIREMTGLERTEDHGWRFTVDTTPEAAYDGGRTTDQQGGLDDGQNEYDLRGVHGENVRRREAGETIPGRPRSAQRRNAAGSQTDEGGRRAAPASWARGRVIDRPSRAAGIAAENAGRYGADAFVVEDAAIKERNPKDWALTSGGSIYISDSIPAELADVVGYHEAIHAAKQTGNDRYLDFLENTGEYISLSSDRTAEVMGMIIKQRFHGSKSLFDLTPQEQTTAFDELNAVVWGFHKADQENAREQFADMFQDYDAYIADLDAAMESGAEPEVPGLSLPTLDDEDIRYSMDEDTAAEPSDNPPLSPDQSGRSDLHRPRGMSDEQYNRLNERWKNRPVDWRETLAPEGFDSIDDYTAALEAAAEERMRNRSREEFEGSDALKDLGIRIANSVGLYGNTQQLIENDRAAKSIRKEIKRAERRLQATDAEKNFASGVAAGIYGEADIPPSMDADTVMELADYYWAEKAVQNDLIREQRTKINRNLDERVRRLMDGVDDAKTKVPAAVIMRNRTPERNMRRIFGNAKGDEINDYLFRPVQDNEAERIRFVNRMHNEVRTFKDRNGKDRRLNKEERALVQLVIEGRAAEDAVNAMERSRDIQNAAENIKNARKLAGKDDLAKRRQAEIDASVDEAREFNLGTDERRLAIQYSRWLETQERLQGADTIIIGNAVEKYRELFNQLYDAANDFLVAHGYEPIGFIRGYAPHLQSQETQERFNSALERMGINREIGKLPTSIAGRTKNFKPNMPWNGFFKNRNSQGEFLDPDIAEGFEKYVDSMSDVLYHTDDIMRTRAFVRYFRRTYAPEEIRNQLEQADALRYAQADQQASFLRDKGKLSYTSAPTYEDVHQAMEQYVEDQYQAIENLTLYGDLAVFLDDYANNLANKQLFEDRAMEKSFGRTSLNAISKAHRAFARAQVSANLSSALNQGGQLPIILAENGARNVAQALIELRSKDLKSWAAGSDFLTEKKGINYIVTSWKDRAITGAFKPLEIVDGIVSTLAVRSRYLKEVRAGKSAAEAMRLADRFGREVMASRAKGSVPLAFRSKDFLNQMVHMFQLEALNNWEHVIQDLGNRDFREMARAKGKRAAAGSLAAVLVKIILGAFLLNRIDEELYGGTPAPFDVLGLAGNLFAGGLGLTQMDLLQTLVDNGWERLTGERLFGTDAEMNEFDAAAGFDDFVWNGLNEIPFASNVAALAGMGDRTLPMPDLSNLADLPGTIAEDGLFSWEVARQLAGLAGDFLPGGRQAEKTVQGLEALVRGGYYRGSGENRRLQFPVEQDFWSIVRGTLFGRSALDESRDFYASGQTGLSANQTKAYEQIVDMGADPEPVYQAIQGWRAAENDEDLNSYGRGVAKRDAITEADLTDEQKLALYRRLSDADSSTPDHFRAMMDTGLSWEEIMEAYDQYQFLNSDEDVPEADRLSASEKATEFASWVDRQNYTEDQAETVKEALRYWQMIPAEVSEKILLAQEYGVSDSSRRAAADEIDRLKGDGNSVTQDMAAEALENMPGLDNRERAILWQLQNKSWKWNKNPFDKRVGREVYDRMHEEDED